MSEKLPKEPCLDAMGSPKSERYRKEMLDKARGSFNNLKIACDFQWYGILLSNLAEAQAKPEDIGTTQKEIHILMLKTFLYYAQWALRILDDKIMSTSSAYDLFRGRLTQANNFAIDNAGNIVDISTLTAAPVEQEAQKIDGPTREIVIEVIGRMLDDISEILDAMERSDSAYHLVAFIEALDIVDKTTLKYEQILCDE